MFGYVTVNLEDMSEDEKQIYRSYYCGLCSVLSKRYGKSGQMTLTYDLTFLTILLTSLYEPESVSGLVRCHSHPLHKQPTLVNEFSYYCADVEILLSYYKCLDDINDDGKAGRKAFERLLRKHHAEAQKRLPEKNKIILDKLNDISECEKNSEHGLETCAVLFGELLAEVFDVYGDFWSESLRAMGFYLGKFIYLMDAFDDMEDDRKAGSYNPFLVTKEDEWTEETIREILTIMMGECCRAFERLPIIENADILRNILYSGVWLKFNMLCDQREKRRNKS